MYPNPERFVSAGKSRIESLVDVANVLLVTAERFATLNLNTTRAMLDDATANARALVEAKDTEGLIAIQADIARPIVERAVSYSRSAYGIASHIQGELAKIIETQIAAAQNQIIAMLDQAAEHAPVDSDAAVAAVKSAIAAANSAYGQMNKAAKQAVEIAEANVSAASDATVKAGATGKAKKIA